MPVPDLALIQDWISLAVRWTHVVTAIAWIGSSFYFIALDLGLRKAPDLPEGVQGEEWQVHGGGFYHVRKYMVAPARMPGHLTWFKWESYSTWISGAALLMLTYWAGAELLLIDPARLALAPWQGIAISALSLGLGWILYDALCRSRLGARPGLLMGVLFAILLAMGWGYDRVFSGRAAMLHLGAFTATIMTANVFLVIIPNQRIVVADLRAGRAPDPRLGRIAKLRSTHNNYLTLPVVFLMLSNHYPVVFASRWNWLIAGLVFLMGVTIRHFFNTMHAGRGRPWWCWGLTAALFVAAIWLSSAGLARDTLAQSEARAPTPRQQAMMAAPGWPAAQDAVLARCSMCHARDPGWPGIRTAPRGILLETADDITRAARQVYLQAGLTQAMPPANASFMEPEERRAIVAWYRAIPRGAVAD